MVSACTRSSALHTMACMKGKNKRKHTNGFNEDRLMLISWAAPVLAQLVMLVVMIAQRQWLYVAMLARGLSAARCRWYPWHCGPRQKQQYDEPADATPSKIAGNARADIDRHYSTRCPVYVSNTSTV